MTTEEFCDLLRRAFRNAGFSIEDVEDALHAPAFLALLDSIADSERAQELARRRRPWWQFWR